MTRANHELILGGARSGKSGAAERRAASWLAAGPERSATLVATALPADEEMSARIARHRADRAARAPALATIEAPKALGLSLRALAEPNRLLIVDCLTLWLTQCLLPPPRTTPCDPWSIERDGLLEAVHESSSPIVFVSNEIGLGVMPLAAEARMCVDALGLLHQTLAEHCSRVTLMVAGCEHRVKDLP